MVITTMQGCPRENLTYKEIDLLYIPNFPAGIPAWSLPLNGGLTVPPLVDNFNSTLGYHIGYNNSFNLILINVPPNGELGINLSFNYSSSNIIQNFNTSLY